VLRLTLFAPDLIEAILDGRQPAGMQPDDLLKGFPLEWAGQKEHLAIGDRSIRAGDSLRRDRLSG
jgi:hypothetical protein